MEKRRAKRSFSILGVYLCVSAIFILHCDATKSNVLLRPWKNSRSPKFKQTSKMLVLKRFDMGTQLDSSDTVHYVSSPLTLPPYDSLSPTPLPDNSPPYCVYPPFTPQSPSAINPPSPTGGYTPLPPSLPFQSPPPGPPNFGSNPSGPPTNVPTPTQPGSGPPFYEPSPPSFTPSPPRYVPSPTGFSPGPPVFLPPIVYPPPTGPPPPRTASPTALWCVAKPSVPDPIIQEAMNYACGSGADCDQIQPSGSCFSPNTLLAHASYAFNSYWQRTKVAGGTCEFGGTAMLVTVDPSYDGCHFVYF